MAMKMGHFADHYAVSRKLSGERQRWL